MFAKDGASNKVEPVKINQKIFANLVDFTPSSGINQWSVFILRPLTFDDAFLHTFCYEFWENPCLISAEIIDSSSNHLMTRPATRNILVQML